MTTTSIGTDLTDTLYQFYTKSHFENNQGIIISDDEWNRFVEECGDVFANACGDIATEVWEANNNDYAYSQN